MSHLFIEQLKEKGLKVTPQRAAIYEAIVKLNNHPTTENIIDYIKSNYLNISIGTVYKVLDTLVENNLIKKDKPEKDIMRYDAFLSNHPHLYCVKTDRIEDDQLSLMIENYFQSHQIKKFTIHDIKLQITGKFKK